MLRRKKRYRSDLFPSNKNPIDCLSRTSFQQKRNNFSSSGFILANISNWIHIFSLLLLFVFRFYSLPFGDEQIPGQHTDFHSRTKQSSEKSMLSKREMNKNMKCVSIHASKISLALSFFHFFSASFLPLFSFHFSFTSFHRKFIAIVFNEWRGHSQAQTTRWRQYFSYFSCRFFSPARNWKEVITRFLLVYKSIDSFDFTILNHFSAFLISALFRVSETVKVRKKCGKNEMKNEKWSALNLHCFQLFQDGKKNGPAKLKVNELISFCWLNEENCERHTIALIASKRVTCLCTFNWLLLAFGDAERNCRWLLGYTRCFWNRK